MRIDAARPPLPFNQIQCANMEGWTGDLEAPGWRKVVASVAELVSGATDYGPPAASRTAPVANLRRPARASLWATAAAAAVVLLAGAAFLLWGPLGKTPAPLSSMRSVAILPIRNLTGDASLDAVADTLAEDVIDVEGRAGMIVVTPRDTAFALKGKPVDEQVLGRQLHVRNIVAASLRKSAPGFRVSFQVVDTASGQVVGARDVGSTASDSSLAERQLALKLYGAIMGVVLRRWSDAEMARPPDDHDPDNIVARLAGLDEANRRQDIGSAERLIAAGRAAITKASPIREPFDMDACDYDSNLIAAGYETSPAQRAAWAADALNFGAEAAELKPNATLPHACRAGVFSQLEHWDEATAEARHIIAIFPLTANG